MTRSAYLLLIPCLVAAFALGTTTGPGVMASPKLAHMVFFSLKQHSREAKEALVASCYRNLKGIEGTVYFSVGTIAEDADEPDVSIRDFDVALHVVFEDKATRDKYLTHPRHVAFVKENRETFSKVRVFDSYLSAPN